MAKRWNLELDTNNHAVFSLNYHLVLVVKYRRKVIDDTISQTLREIFERIGKNHGVTVTEWNHDRDHIHVLLKTEPGTDFSRFLNAYKAASSRLIKKEYPEIRQKLWKEYFWSRSYCLITTGGAPLEVLKKYTLSQGKKDEQAEHSDGVSSASISGTGKKDDQDSRLLPQGLESDAGSGNCAI